jgi:plastocyanin
VTRAALTALAVALALPATASAADQTVQAVDATLAWSPATVTVKAGESVTWTFAGTTQAHNVASSSPNWSLSTPIQANHPPVSHTFASPGTYTFVCNVHPSTMTGTVTVTDASGTPPPPPPPPPPGQQPYPNDQSPPSVVEITDTSRPRLTHVRASRIARGVRVRFHVSEPARVRVRVRRDGRTVRARTVRLRQAGTRALRLRGLSAGSYRIDVLARDLALNRSRLKRARVTVR